MSTKKGLYPAYTLDIAPLVLLLASPLSAAITDQSITIDGGALRSIAY